LQQITFLLALPAPMPGFEFMRRLKLHGTLLKNLECVGLLFKLFAATFPPGAILDHILPFFFEQTEESRMRLLEGAAARRATCGRSLRPQKLNPLAKLSGPLSVSLEPGFSFLASTGPFHGTDFRLSRGLNPICPATSFIQGIRGIEGCNRRTSGPPFEPKRQSYLRREIPATGVPETGQGGRGACEILHSCHRHAPEPRA
jgi:hypothetical protein